MMSEIVDLAFGSIEGPGYVDEPRSSPWITYHLNNVFGFGSADRPASSSDGSGKLFVELYSLKNKDPESHARLVAAMDHPDTGLKNLMIEFIAARKAFVFPDHRKKETNDERVAKTQEAYNVFRDNLRDFFNNNRFPDLAKIASDLRVCHDKSRSWHILVARDNDPCVSYYEKTGKLKVAQEWHRRYKKFMQEGDNLAVRIMDADGGHCFNFVPDVEIPSKKDVRICAELAANPDHPYHELYKLYPTAPAE